jgi:hypothetical protein
VFARVHTIESDRQQYDFGLEIIREEYLPWVRDSSGFRGLIGLFDEEREKSIVITLWADEKTLDESADAGDRLSLLAASFSGSRRRSLESFEVTLFEVLPDP